MSIRNVLLGALAALVLFGCGSGPARRVSPPTASIQELSVGADGRWHLLVRVQNFSNVEMTFSAIDAGLEIDGTDVAMIAEPLKLDIPGESADVFETTITPTAGRAPGPADFAYRLHGSIESSEPQGKFNFERKSRLSPAPGLPNTWR